MLKKMNLKKHHLRLEKIKFTIRKYNSLEMYNVQLEKVILKPIIA